ncbi:unnamed protein product [Effrenium voratum]|nr:unnamed protein product [Effrenium voratum]
MGREASKDHLSRSPFLGQVALSGANTSTYLVPIQSSPQIRVQLPQKVGALSPGKFPEEATPGKKNNFPGALCLRVPLRQRGERRVPEASKASETSPRPRLLDLGSSEAFKLLRREGGESGSAGALLAPRLRRFFQVDAKEACELAVACRAAVPVDAVIAALEGCENRWKHEYLKLLFAQDEIAGQGYHMQMVELFAEYDPSGLLPFLRASERYPLEQALEVCQRKGLREEVAYLLGRAGRVADALRILLEEVGDVGRAVEFASETQDARLWETLVSFVLQHSQLLVPLLDHLDALESQRLRALGSESQYPQPPPIATPAHVLRLLPSETPLPRIASSVQRALDSLRLSVDLKETCSKISAAEMANKKKVCMAARRRGAGLRPPLACGLCGGERGAR